MEPYQLDHFKGWFDTYTNRFLDKLFEYLPQTTGTARLRDRIHEHMETRLTEASAHTPSETLGRRAGRLVERPGPRSR